MLSVAHAWFFSVFISAMPGRTRLMIGLFSGFTIWAMYWVFQEWFVYVTIIASAASFRTSLVSSKHR